jgi:acyl-homoserine-lactone acylase
MNKIHLLLIILTGCSTQVSNDQELTEKERWKQYSSNTEIIRDDFGIPHIYGKTDADAVFGLLYSQCEDDFYRLEHNYIWATGRLAEVEGEEALYSDLRANLFMTHKEAKDLFENSPDWLRKLCIAFADGINFYLVNHPEVKPKLLTHFEPWMPMYFTEGSIGGDIERVSTKKIKEFYDQSTGVKITGFHDGLIRHKDNEPSGSNGLAISGDCTASGNAMLLINPHTSFYFRGEAHVISEEGLNAYGAVTWGQFFVYQGFNDKDGWMHTSTDTDVIDEFEETIVRKKQGLTYKYGNEYRAVDSAEVVLKYLEENEIKERKFTIYRTHHGPVTHSKGEKWIATAMMWNPVKALEQSFTRMKTSNYKEFHQTMNIRTNSSNNTVFADADGNIAYYHGNFIPKRDTSFDYTNSVDGSNLKTDWQRLHTLDENIFVLNPKSGWIQNCNSTPFTCCGDGSPKEEDYPVYMTYKDENFRGIHAISLLNNAQDLTLDKLITLAYDPYLPGADTLMKGVIEAYDDDPENNIDIQNEVEALKAWDFSVSETSIGMTLSHYYLSTFRRFGQFPEGLNGMDRMYYIASGSSFEERLNIFRKALKNLTEDFGSTEIAWGEINRYQRNNGDIIQIFNDSLPSLPVGMASGSWGALASFGARRGENTKCQYGVSGNSFIAVVEFGDIVKAKSLLAGGQSSNPDSPHFDDQAQRYVDCLFKDIAYYREDVLKRAKSTYHPGEEN